MDTVTIRVSCWYQAAQQRAPLLGGNSVQFMLLSRSRPSSNRQRLRHALSSRKHTADKHSTAQKSGSLLSVPAEGGYSQRKPAV